jgi:hypothetical protein
MASLVALVIIGYVRPWKWTGFTGNTLWDWINLVAVPLLFPLVILPTAMNLIRTGVDERKEAAETEAARARGEAPPEATAPQPAAPAPPAPTPAPTPAAPGRGGLATVAVAAVIALVIGGVAGALAFGDSGSSSTSTNTSSATAANPCTRSGTTDLASDTGLSVVRAGANVYACPSGAGKPLALGTVAGTNGPTAFAPGHGRVVFADQKCGANGNSCSTLVKLVRLSDGHVFAPHRFTNVGKVARIVSTPAGGVAVLFSDPSQLWLMDKAGAREVASGAGLDLHSLAEAGGTVYWRSNGRTEGQMLGHCAAC